MGRKQRLPGAVEWEWTWQEAAACAQRDARLFFHPAGERGESFRERELAAKQICFHCPVLTRCREYALAHREPYGVWGGLSESDRWLLLHSAGGRNGCSTQDGRAEPRRTASPRSRPGGVHRR